MKFLFVVGALHVGGGEDDGEIPIVVVNATAIFNGKNLFQRQGLVDTGI